MEEMNSKKSSELVRIIVMIMIMGIIECCMESERNGLLQIKSSFNSSGLSSWGSLSDNCCSWERVECNSTTGHVTSLDLSFIRDSLQFQSSLFPNTSVFLPFEQLNLLSLQGNNIASCIKNQGFERLSTFANLEILDLSYNRFNNTILHSLSGLQTLKSLDLRYNELKGTINVSELSHLPSTLEELNFSENEIEAFESVEGLERLSPLTNLEVLDLSGNKFNNITLYSLSGLQSLKSLYLGANYFKRAIDILGICNLKRLQDLDISYNDLNGNLPSCLGNMSSLQSLDISVNHLRILISLSPFFNLLELRVLDVSDNTVYEDIDHNLIPKFQLQELYMIGYGGGVETPKFLYHQHNLQYLHISSVKLRGRFPYWLLQNNSRLETLVLENNSLSGPIQLPNRPHANLTFFYISDNFFNGSIPSNIGTLFPNLKIFDTSGNNLKGSIPVSLCNSTKLNFLDISQNALSGRIPKCFGNMFYLEILDLSENNISSSLPTFSRENLRVVNLSKNKLLGSLKDAFSASRYLLQLDLSHNNISGTIPSWIGELSELSFIVLGYNNFQGHIPIELCHLKRLSFIDLSHNNIIGHIIPCLNLTDSRSSAVNKINYITDIEMTMKGRTYMYEKNVLQYVFGIDISCNNMTGDIPAEIGNLTKIKALNLSQNFFTGEIPPTLSYLIEIESLDLSLNHLQGMIPPQLTKLTYLSAFNVSYNNLSGTVPNAVNQFGIFNESSYKGNPFLCGLPLLKSCSSAYSPPSNARIFPNHDSNRNKLIDMEDFFVTFGISYGTVSLILVAILCINPCWRRVWFYYIQMSIDKTYYFFINNVIPLFSKFWFSFAKF